MSKRKMGISTRMHLDDRRNLLIMQLYGEGYSLAEVASIIRITKASANRIIRFGKNTSKRAPESEG